VDEEEEQEEEEECGRRRVEGRRPLSSAGAVASVTWRLASEEGSVEARG